MVTMKNVNIVIRNSNNILNKTLKHIVMIKGAKCLRGKGPFKIIVV